MLDQQQPIQNAPNDNAEDCVASAIHKCDSKTAKQLWIFDPLEKLSNDGSYDICGTYNEGEPEVWFYFTSSACPGGNYLLNLFFVYRNVGDIVIGVSDSDELSKPVNGTISLRDSLQYFPFETNQPNENHYLKTYNLSAIQSLLKKYKDGNLNFVEALVMPIKIKTQAPPFVNPDIKNDITLNHFRGLFFKMGQTDYTIEIPSGQQFHVHKIIVALRSSVLRDIISKNPTRVVLDLSDEDMDLLFSLLYYSVIKYLSDEKSKRLSEISKEYKISYFT